MKYSYLSDETLEFLLEECIYLEYHDVSYSNGTQRHQIKVAFPNGFGMSCIKEPSSYGQDHDLWEVAVLFEEDICYDTYITDDVCGYVTDEGIKTIAKLVMDLRQRETTDADDDGEYYDDEEDENENENE